MRPPAHASSAQLPEPLSAYSVDTAGFGNQAATVAAAAADLVLVPVAPGEADVIEAQRTDGCARVYFGMSVSTDYLTATINAAAPAGRDQSRRVNAAIPDDRADHSQ